MRKETRKQTSQAPCCQDGPACAVALLGLQQHHEVGIDTNGHLTEGTHTAAVEAREKLPVTLQRPSSSVWRGKNGMDGNILLCPLPFCSAEHADKVAAAPGTHGHLHAASSEPKSGLHTRLHPQHVCTCQSLRR
ncbi:hypothetical protein H1C71_003734 [Ictidomys tridecemlineatus]|nr:hypothetical protein H1C71_003734 [Ictidomys tridecemlineatus]